MSTRTFALADWNAVEAAVKNSEALRERALSEARSHLTRNVGAYGLGARDPQLYIRSVEVRGSVTGGSVAAHECVIQVGCDHLYAPGATDPFTYRIVLRGEDIFELLGEDFLTEEPSDEDAGEE